jgi:hypothetical protein
MATVTKKQAATTYVLELSEAEALYVRSALTLTTPTDAQFGDLQDPVHEALSDAMHPYPIHSYAAVI